MIALLEGTIRNLKPNEMILWNQGVGYELTISLALYDWAKSQLTQKGKDFVVQVWVHTHHKEDQYRLFGFISQHERNFFRRLLALPGIGPTMGLVIVSSIEWQDFIRALQEDDSHRLTLIPGVGKSKGERIIFEYKKKYKKWQEEQSDFTGLEKSHSPQSQENNEWEDTFLGLVALGYGEKEARLWAARAWHNALADWTSSDAIRHILQKMVKK